MALTAVFVFILLCAAALLARPGEGVMKTLTTQASGGVLARRLLPAAILFPSTLGWVCWQGQLDGLYGTSLGLILFSGGEHSDLRVSDLDEIGCAELVWTVSGSSPSGI